MPRRIGFFPRRGSGISPQLFELLSNAIQSDPAVKPGTILGISALKFRNPFQNMIRFSSVTYRWEDGDQNLISESPTLPLGFIDNGKHIYLRVNAIDIDDNPMVEKVFDFGVVTNPDSVTSHQNDFREIDAAFYFTSDFNLILSTPSQPTKNVTFMYDSKKKHALVTGEAGEANMLLDSGGFINRFRRAFFHTPIGKRTGFYISMTVRFSGGGDDILFARYLTGFGDTSLAHDDSVNRIVFNNGTLRLDNIPTNQWGVVTLSWFDRGQGTTNSFKLQADFLNPLGTIADKFGNGTPPELNLEDNIGLSSGSTTTIEMNFGDLAELHISEPGNNVLTEQIVQDIHDSQVAKLSNLPT